MEHARPFRREARILIGALVVFLLAMIVTLFALAVSILRIDRVRVLADAASAAIGPTAAAASSADLHARLELLRSESDIARVEVYRGERLHAAAGTFVPAAEVITRPIPGGKMLFYFDVSRRIGGQRNALVIGALATIVTVAGLLILILYLPKFLTPVEQMLASAQQLGGTGERPRDDDDARYLVSTFREAVERIQLQATEIDSLRDAATRQTADVRTLAQTVHRSFSSGFLALDANGLVVAINEAGRTILGLDSDTPAEPFALAELTPSFAALIRESFDTRTGLTRREVHLEQKESVIGVTTVPLLEDGAFLGMLALFTDLTTLRAMEARLRDFENLVGLGQMSAGIAHEFRNSLFTVLGYLRLADRSSTPENVAHIRNAETEAKKLATAVDGLLSFARPLSLRAQRLRLDELLRKVVDHFAAEHRDVAISAQLDDAVELDADAELLERAFENLLRNAVDAVRQQHPDGGGAIDVSLVAQPHPTIVIRDNGVGFDAEHATTFLLPFQTRKSHGFGLGLPLARKIVLHHGGALTLTGAPGEGAAVRIEFFGTD